MREINKIYIHESMSTWGSADIIKKWHVEGNGWSDIGYHYVICNGHMEYNSQYSKEYDGLLQKGRPAEKKGAHVFGENDDSIGICLIGRGKYTRSQYVILTHLLEDMMVQYNLGIEAILGHYESKNACGKLCPEIDMNNFRKFLGNVILTRSLYRNVERILPSEFKEVN
jgi:hypothetical protein